MNRIIFTVQANTSAHVFKRNPTALDYVFRMYEPAVLAQYQTQINYCIAQGWLDAVPEYGPDDPESWENAHTCPTSCVFVDTNKNSFTFVMTGSDLQAVWDYFVLDNRNFESMVNHYAANPNEGTISLTIMYGSIPQTIDPYQLYA